MSTSVNNIKISAKISPGVDLYTIESNLSKEEIVEKYQCSSQTITTFNQFGKFPPVTVALTTE